MDGFLIIYITTGVIILGLFLATTYAETHGK